MECLGFNIVHQETVGIEERFGSFSKVLGPGLHWLNPCSGRSIRGRLDLRTQELLVPCQVTTKDYVRGTVEAAVWHRVDPEHAREAFYNSKNLNRQLQTLAINVIGAATRFSTRNDLADQAFINDLERAVAEEVRTVMAPYGYMIDTIRIRDVVLDEQFRAATNAELVSGGGA